MGHGTDCKCEKLENRVGGSRMDSTKLGIFAFRGEWLRFGGGLVEQRAQKMKTRLASDHIEAFTVAAGTMP